MFAYILSVHVYMCVCDFLSTFLTLKTEKAASHLARTLSTRRTNDIYSKFAAKPLSARTDLTALCTVSTHLAYATHELRTQCEGFAIIMIRWQTFSNILSDNNTQNSPFHKRSTHTVESFILYRKNKKRGTWDYQMLETKRICFL